MGRGMYEPAYDAEDIEISSDDGWSFVKVTWHWLSPNGDIRQVTKTTRAKSGGPDRNRYTQAIEEARSSCKQMYRGVRLADGEEE